MAVAEAPSRPRQRWLLIGPTVVLLLARGVNRLVQLGLGEAPTDRLVLWAALSVLAIVAALLLLAGGRVGWLLAMGVLGLGLAAELVVFWVGEPDYVSMALLATCAILITSPEMRAAHLGRR